jgi:hypothetical protein
MGKVQIFKVELRDHASGASLTLAAGRELNGDHFLDLGEFVLPLFQEQAEAFARAVARLAWRRQRATPRPGAVWKRLVGDGVGPPSRLEVGITDEGRLYVEAAGVKIVCDDGQGDLLLAVLERFAEDVASVQQQADTEPHHLDMAPGLRSGFGLPRWADDTKWR